MPRKPIRTQPASYENLLKDIALVLEAARTQTVRVVNSVLTLTYWDIGRRIVQFEQKGKVRAAYGEGLLKRLSSDLSKCMGRGFSKRNLEQMQLFYLQKPIAQTLSAQLRIPSFPLSWSHYVLLLSVDDAKARAFYEIEALQNG